ncbi:hypothetical protein [uncultured Parasutterella sp.]|jgi:hypothetical protein|uniref:hypothetical protein n=1 Tax=uncultured Parasutterella sp. TaxID=1263098 RepID=UPI0025D5DADD|nr:hypothetical protein [uncultured Parasutterella sp.]
MLVMILWKSVKQRKNQEYLQTAQGGAGEFFNTHVAVTGTNSWRKQSRFFQQFLEKVTSAKNIPGV